MWSPFSYGGLDETYHSITIPRSKPKFNLLPYHRLHHLVFLPNSSPSFMTLFLVVYVLAVLQSSSSDRNRQNLEILRSTYLAHGRSRRVDHPLNMRVSNTPFVVL